MKSFSGLFFVAYLFCAVIAFPSSNLDDDAEIVVIPLQPQQQQTNFEGQKNKNENHFDGAIITDFHPGFSSSLNPYLWNAGFFDRFYDVFRQLREQIHSAWGALPNGSGNPENNPAVKSNSTSTVEYIDGHKVLINDTFYKKETDFGTSFYNVRVIDFMPVDDDESNITIDGGNRELDTENVDVKTEIKASTDGELDRGSPEIFENNDNDNDDDNEINKEIDDVENFELDDDINQQQQLQNQHQHQQIQQHQPPPLEEQNYNNNRLEEFMPNNSPSPASEHSWESIEDENENINMNEHNPVDLSNDIAINQMAADQGVPYDSDAEIFSIDEDAQYPISTTYKFVPVDIKK